LIVVPRVLDEMGVLGPGLDDAYGRAAGAIEAARAYWAAPGDQPFEAATKQLERAGGLDEAARSTALSLMNEARQTGARLLLAYEEGDFDRVVGDENAATAALAAGRERLGRMGGTSGTRAGRSAQARH